MTLRHLKIFVTVCECDSVTRAAEKLYIAQPSVSLAISELEGYYGVKLFDRISRKLYLTEVGKRFLDYAIHIKSLLEEMEQNITDWETKGILRIGASITTGSCLLPDYTDIFKKQFPQMQVQVVIDNSEEIEKHILQNNIDFALIEGMVHSPHIKCQSLMKDELVLICGKNHPLYIKKNVDITELATQEFILREKGSGVREFFDSIMLLHGIKITPVWQSVSTHAVVTAVSKGLGLSVLPYLLVKADLENGYISTLEIRDISLKRQISIIYHKNKYLTHGAQAFINICIEESRGGLL